MPLIWGPVFAIALGAFGGAMAAGLGLPMPWLLGALLITALWVQVFPPKFKDTYRTPRSLVTAMICVIGVMIGGAFTPDLAGAILRWWPSVLGVVAFSLVGQFGAYLIYSRLFSYDTATAFFSASPGGFVENIAMGTEAGGDETILTLLQFLRMVTIIFLVPLGYSIWLGHPVGSAAGTSFGPGGAADAGDYALMLAAAVGGYWLAHWARVPVAMVIGPLAATALLHLTGLLTTQPHAVVMIAAQVVVGTSLGARFSGLNLADMVRAFRSIAVVVVWFGAVVLICAYGIALVTGFTMPDLIMSFAPAGVIEMSLVALSMGTNPVFVTTHHVVRILVTVLVVPVVYHRWIAPKGD